MKRTTKKLAFTKHSVRLLTQHELHAANGGVIPTFQGACGMPTASGNQSGCDSTITTFDSLICASVMCPSGVCFPG